MTAHERRTVRRRRFPALLLAGYLLVLSVIAFWPSPVDESAVEFIMKVLNVLHFHGLPGWANYDLLETGSNVALFLPFGLLAAACLPMKIKWLAVVAGMGASALIEAAQEVLRPERFAAVQDVLANSLGAAVGTVMVYAWLNGERLQPPT